MKLLSFLFCFMSTLFTLMAYPLDYNETTDAITREALNALHELIYNNKFSELLQEYNDDISPINIKTYEKIYTYYNTHSQHLLQIQASASNVNADITECLENLNQLTPSEFYDKYTEDCVNPARALGVSLRSLGFDLQTIEFYKKYDELMSNFMGCMAASDPVPHICEGVVESTLMEARRILPAVKTNPLKIEREMKQQIFVLSECANQQLSIVNQRLETEFNNAKTCILSKVNTA